MEIDLSKYCDTLNHELLMNMVREEVKDKRVTDLIKKYLKSGVKVEGLLVKTEEGSPQGGPLSPLLANIYLNKFDQKMTRRGVRVIRYPTGTSPCTYAIEPPCTEPYARWCWRTVTQRMGDILPDLELFLRSARRSSSAPQRRKLGWVAASNR